MRRKGIGVTDPDSDTNRIISGIHYLGDATRWPSTRPQNAKDFPCKILPFGISHHARNIDRGFGPPLQRFHQARPLFHRKRAVLDPLLYFHPFAHRNCCLFLLFGQLYPHLG